MQNRFKACVTIHSTGMSLMLPQPITNKKRIMNRHPTKTNNFFRQLHTPQPFLKFCKLQFILFILNLKCHLSRCFMAVGQPNIGKIANVYHFHQHSVFSIDNQPDPNPNYEEFLKKNSQWAIEQAFLKWWIQKPLFSGSCNYSNNRKIGGHPHIRSRIYIATNNHNHQH